MLIRWIELKPGCPGDGRSDGFGGATKQASVYEAGFSYLSPPRSGLMATPLSPILKDSPIMLRISLLLFVLLVSAASSAQAQVTIPNTFTNGEVADAAEVNANFSALANALDVTVPSSFANSGIADANQVNSNFDVLKTAVDTFTNDLAAATSATDTAFANGSVQGAASVDITTDNAAAEAAAGSAACTQAGGTWDAGTSTCTPAAAPYNCFIGGFCSQAAIDFPPANWGYTNVYEGHTQTTEPALGAGCRNPVGDSDWNYGFILLIQNNNPVFFGMCQ